MKKIIMITVSIIAVVALAVLAGWLIGGYKSGGSNSYEKAIEVLNDSYPSNIMCYGDGLKFPESVKVNMIKNISEEELTAKKGAKFNFLIINDSASNINLNKDEIKLLKNMVDSNKLNVYYIGTSMMQAFVDAGMLLGMPDKDELSVAYIYSMGRGVALRGVWTEAEKGMLKDNESLLEELLINSFVDDVIKLNV